MTRILTIFCALLLAVSSVFADPPSGLITLLWMYPTNSITPDLSFIITATNTLSVPLTNWPVVAVVVATNSHVDIVGQNYRFYQPFQMQPGQMFFVTYASNFWGMTSNSNTASTPPMPIPIYQTITRTN